MRIQVFTPIITENLKKLLLNDSTLVIDGKNFWYNAYNFFNIPFAFGCESDNLAQCLKEYLKPFKKANIDCYFVFKGGHSNIEKYFQKRQKALCKDYIPGEDIFFNPLYVTNIIREVLDEIGFKYVFCEYESKNTCIALAQKLSCPVVSFDMEFIMFGIDYVPHNITSTHQSRENIKDKNGKMECGVFNLLDFLNKQRITTDDFILFVVLRDEHIFPENYFINFFKMIKSPLSNYKRNKFLLNWLSNKGKSTAVDQLLKVKVDKNQLVDAMDKVKAILNRKVDEGLPVLYFFDEVKIDQFDPQWFEKGITLKHIDASYVNLYRSKMVCASNIIQDCTQENALILSLEILKYAYDLLTDFKGGEVTVKFLYDYKQPIKIGFSTQRPNYECKTCVFENGWENIKNLNLFQHFISETLESFDFDILEKAPEDARLLIIALVYFSRQKDASTRDETLSILMSYVMLNVVFKNTDLVHDTIEERLDANLDDNYILQSDCEIAIDCLKSYFKASNIKESFDFKVYHPLAEFQHCLEELNKLNNLCGRPYKPTVYSKTYNGSFVYNFLLHIKNNGIECINKILQKSVTVLKYFNNLWHTFIEIEPKYKIFSTDF